MTWVAPIAYLLAAAGWIGLKFMLPGDGSTKWAAALDLVFSPALVVWMLVVACITAPYWWLYPERHAHEIDFYGTDEEKQWLAEYRDILSRKPFWRRLAERLRLAEDTSPPWPDFEERE